MDAHAGSMLAYTFNMKVVGGTFRTACVLDRIA
jgi:hypothetical protein